jgi:hypothetical protein
MHAMRPVSLWEMVLNKLEASDKIVVSNKKKASVES